MNFDSDNASTRPYLIRALFEWCVDQGLTPYLLVVVNDRVRVPKEFIKNGEIVLNISPEAPGCLQLGPERGRSLYRSNKWWPFTPKKTRRAWPFPGPPPRARVQTAPRAKPKRAPRACPSWVQGLLRRKNRMAPRVPLFQQSQQSQQFQQFQQFQPFPMLGPRCWAMWA